MPAPRLHVVNSALPDPPYDAAVFAKGWRFELDPERIKQSDTWVLADAELRPWLLMLWITAWEQRPCGSLPNDDQLIGARIGMRQQHFMAVKDVLLRGWWLASDGRLYHHVITERVEQMLLARDGEKKRKAAFREKHKNQQLSSNVPRDTRGTPTGRTLPEPEPEPEPVKYPVLPTVVGQQPAAADRFPPCPHQEIIGLYKERFDGVLTVPVLSLWRGDKAKQLKDRWHWALTACREDGSRYATNAGEALQFFRDLFDHVSQSDFLMGRRKEWRCDLEWIVKPSNFTKIIENRYVNRQGQL